LFPESTTNKTISARPSKIVAGLEVSKTLELLIAIVFGIETKVKYFIIKEDICVPLDFSVRPMRKVANLHLAEPNFKLRTFKNN